MSIDLKQHEGRMQKALDSLDDDYGQIRAGRANPRVLDSLRVDYYGTPSPIQSVANISVPEPRIIQIQPWESSLIKDIEKAILGSDIGITPNSDGKIIRLIFPELTEERRIDLAKDVRKKAEGSKVSIRNIRRDANDEIKKLKNNSDISEDEARTQEEDVQKLTDKYTDKIDKLADDKEKEILTI